MYKLLDILNNEKKTILAGECLEYKVAQNIAKKIEQQFNTKVFKFGVAKKGTSEFDSMTPFGTIASEETDLLFWFLIPIGDADNVITNNYYEKAQIFNDQNTNYSYSPLLDFGQSEFQSILIQDWDVSNYLQELVDTQVYDTGSMKVNSYNAGDNIVSNAAKIEDLRYRFFKFYTQNLEKFECDHCFETVLEKTLLLEDNALENEKICVILECQETGDFIFTRLKIEHFKIAQSVFFLDTYSDFYVFKTDKYPNLSKGKQINLNLDYYDSFNKNENKVHYDKRHFSKSDIIELKTYEFV
jgi:hypothetical protein